MYTIVYIIYTYIRIAYLFEYIYIRISIILILHILYIQERPGSTFGLLHRTSRTQATPFQYHMFKTRPAPWCAKA